MKVRSVTFAFVSSVFLAALGATSSSVFASPPATNPLAAQAYSALASGDNDRAISLYSQAIEARDLAPELLANALLNRALAYQQQNKNGSAIDDYTAALSLDAMSAELRATALYNRGLSQQKLSKTTLAIEDFTSALMLNPTFAHAFYSRGNALRISGQYLFALSDFERALKYNHPDPARVYFGQAQTFELLQRPIDARRAFEAALAANPNFALAREKLAALNQVSPPAAEVAYAETDTILTGSISAVGGNTLVHKPDLPLGVEPPENLVGENTTEINVAETQLPRKLYTDRVPQTEVVSAAVAKVAEPTPPSDKMVILASVPEIPKPSAKAAKLAAVPVKKVIEADDEVTTASIDKAEVAPAAVLSGWNVQIASATSEDAAWSTWKKMQKMHPILATKKASVIKADLGAKGTFYRVKLTGFADQSAASTNCSKLKNKGVACFVSKASS
jgi:tetratricopeptide (TPR) repeat protein